MNVIVCVKQIPDPAQPGALDPSDNTLKRDGKLILDESDSYGVEMALQLVGAAGDGEVSLVSMAPNGEVSGLRTALAMGAAKAVLVSDPELAGSDALTTAKVLAAAVQRLGDADLIIAGTESSDGYTGTVPEQIAEVLGLPSVTFAKHVEVDGDVLKVNRQTEAGYDEVTTTMPAVVSVTAGVVEPRYPSFKGIMAAKSKPVDTVTAADLGVTPVGWAGAGQQIVDVASAPEREAGEVDRGRRRGLHEDRRVPRQAQGHLSRDGDERCLVSNIWVFAQSADGRADHRHARAADQGPFPGRRRSGHGVRRPATPATSPPRSASTAPPRSTPPVTSTATCPASPWRRR